MANGTDSEKFVTLSRVRAGLKREFEFALKVQAEISGSLGRTRARKNLNGVSCSQNSSHSPNNQSHKKLKSCPSKIEEKEKGVHKDPTLSKLLGPAKIKGGKTDAVSEEEEAKSDVVDLEDAKGDLVELVSERGSADESALHIAEEESALVELGEAMSEEQKKEQKEGNGPEKVSNGKDDMLEEEQPKNKDKNYYNELVVMEEDKPEKEPEMREPGKELVKDQEKSVETELTKEREKEGLNRKETSVPCEVGSSGSSGQPILDSSDGNVTVENASSKKPLRRFTRSLLKGKAKTVEKTAIEGDVEETNAKEVANGDVSKVVDAVSSSKVATPTKQERGMPKKVVRNFPTKLKDLFESGILEGLCVQYLRGLKVKGTGVAGLPGVVRGSGILCFCSTCKGTEVVSPTTYEMHAGSSNKRPPEYIFLENGNTLRDVMNACRDAPLANLEDTLRMVVGSSIRKSSFCLNCRGPISELCIGKVVILCHSCIGLKESQVGSTATTDAVDRSPTPNLVPKAAHSASKCSSSRSNSQGRVTKKDLRLHKLVFEEDVLPDGTEVAYFVRGQKLLVGYKKGSGILCTCCNEEVSPSQFEAHAGWSTRRKPFQHIYTSNGVSLHELSIAISRDRKLSAKDNDELCSVCSNGGHLLCCDTCPRAFHTAGRVAGVDAIEQISKRSIRIASSPETDVGSVCVLCRGHSFAKSGFCPQTVIICDQCEKEFHVGCLREHKIDDLKELPEGQWFCSKDCNRIYNALQQLMIRGEEELPNSFLNVVKKKLEENGSENRADLDIKWRVLSGKMASREDIKMTLPTAVTIFHECFNPISYSGDKDDLIPAMVFGRQMDGQDFSGMYCAILTVNQVIVSVGVFRIFGSEVAELPLVATRSKHQKQGYFQCLFSCIQRLLSYLKVKELVLPAADEVKSFWTDKFGFKKLTDDEFNNYRKDLQMMMIFHGTSMLRKPVPECEDVGNSADN